MAIAEQLNGTSVPIVLVVLGAVILIASLIERRAAATVGSVLLLLGIGIGAAPILFPGSAPPRAAAIPTPAGSATEPRSGGAPPAHADGTMPEREIGEESAPKATPAFAGVNGANCTALVEAPAKATTSIDWGAEPLYQGFLGNLMPSSELLPCATRRHESRPLTPRDAAVQGGRRGADALDLMAEGGFSGLQRSYGFACSAPIGRNEVPFAELTVLRFDSPAKAVRWASLAPEASVEGFAGANQSMAGWSIGSCGATEAAVFREERRAGNVIVTLTLYTDPDNSGNPRIAQLAEHLAADMVKGFMPVRIADNQESSGDAAAEGPALEPR